MDDKIGLDKAVEHTKLHRQIGTANALGFLITKQTIQEIFEQDSSISGLRIYLGIKKGDEAFEHIACITGTVPDGVTGEQDDFNVPKHGEPLPTGLVIGGARPCPVNCGRANQLNS